MPAKKTKDGHQSLDVYRNHHQWDTTRSKRTLDQAKVDYYINNDMDLNELYDAMWIPMYNDNQNKWKHKKR